MRVFHGFEQAGGVPCPVCGTTDKKAAVLVGIAGTEDGGNIEARQVHLDCIDLTYMETGDAAALYMRFIPKGRP